MSGSVRLPPSATILLALLLAVLSGCAWFGGRTAAPEPEPTLADLQPGRMPDSSVALPSVDLDTLADSYREVMSSVNDPEVKVDVMQRLAGLEMVRGEARLAEGEVAPGEKVLDVAIQAYRELLQKYPDREDNDRLLYQLSKAYDLNGQPDRSIQVLTQLTERYPGSIHRVEAEFRRAEIFFAEADYRRAEQSYAQVVAAGADTSHYRNALYMLGWSQFKRDRYRASLNPFSLTLDTLIPADNNLDSLARAQRELVTDTLRVMSVALSYLDGPATIVELYKQMGDRHYQPLLFDRLGELYLSQERYRDSAEVYRTFVKRFPKVKQAPHYYGKLISAFEAGNFTEQVLAEKENYVNSYGIQGDYWQHADETLRAAIRPHLKEYLDELARHHHALAQGFAQQQEKLSKKLGKKRGNRAKKAALAAKQKAERNFTLAGNYYQAYVDTFPQDKKVPEMLFLLAESRFDAGRYPQAIAAFEKVAYRYPDYPRAADAGYSVILAYQRQLQQTELMARTDWERNKIGSALRFSFEFKDDMRAPLVVAQAAEELLGLQAYKSAVIVAEDLVRWQPQPSQQLLRTAWLVIGHSQFELQNFAQAEIAYRYSLKLQDDKAARKDLTERLAASIYKQGEQLVTAGEQLAAAEQFLRVAEAAPQSAILVNAQYDAATNLLAAAAWERAIAVLKQFRQQHPKHPLSAGVPAKLVEAYQQTEQWQLAAEELSAIYQREKNPEAKREALYLAAELFAKAGDKETAILRYRTYAHGYPQPFGQCMEARFRLSELYRETGVAWKRRFWLKKIIAAEAQADTKSSERSRYLAAFSSSVLADDSYRAYRKIKLTPPLKRSLKKKKAALSTALNAYQKTIDYGIQEFATLGTFRIGEIYAGLSSDLLTSQPPKNLDALALQQYQLLLEEQAYPFEEKAIEIHEANAQRSWHGIYDQWVQQSFAALGELLPARYLKDEQRLGVSHEIY